MSPEQEFSQHAGQVLGRQLQELMGTALIICYISNTNLQVTPVPSVVGFKVPSHPSKKPGQ